MPIIFKWFLKAAALVRQAAPQARFAVAAFKAKQADMARREIEKIGTRDQGPGTGGAIEVYVGKTPELMHLADYAMACSGSVSLGVVNII